MRDLTFSTCSYLKEPTGPRSKFVRQAFRSWDSLLCLPFAERIFLDDHSPNHAALKALRRCGIDKRFDRLKYQDLEHPPHSNFGIVASLEMAKTPYIMHLDDDVRMTGTIAECEKLIALALKTLEQDPCILGFNILALDPAVNGQDWLPGAPYRLTEGLFHPKRLYGTAACIIRRELLGRVGFQEIIAWGKNQPSNWENLVTHKPYEFVTGDLRTPFAVASSSYFYSATADISLFGSATYSINRLLRRAQRPRAKSSV